MATAWLLFGGALLLLALAQRPVRKLPLTPALLYLAAGAALGAAVGAPSSRVIADHDGVLLVATELAVLISLFAVGLRLGVPATWASARVALLLAGPAMVLTAAFGGVAGMLLLGLAWAPALLLAAVLSPTDPVLASEVQVRSDTDRDAVRLAVTAEGGLNDGSALPAVMAGLALMGLHERHPAEPAWWWHELAWPIGGGALAGAALGLGLGRAIGWRLGTGDPMARDELLFLGAVALAYGLALATRTSAFVVAFSAAVTMLYPLRGRRGRPAAPEAVDLGARLHGIGERLERLVEATAVIAVGAALQGLEPSLSSLAYGIVLAVVVRPLAVAMSLHGAGLTGHQRRLVAWFGIRGVGTLFYLAFALTHGVEDPLATLLIDVGLVTIAVSIVLHGVSATPLMARYRRASRAPGNDRTDGP